MTDRYENIRQALAMGPTPGPWKAHDPSESGWVDITNATYATPLCYAVPYSDYQYDAELDCKRFVSRAHETPANAAHIAACDPDTIRALLDERDALREALKELITWAPSADTYRRLGFDPEAPMRALGAARAALEQENDDA